MNNQSSVLVGVLAGALLVALLALAFVFGTSRAQPVSAQSTGFNGTRQITVVGTGEATGTPDTATVQIGVESTAPTTQEALTQNNQQATAIVTKLTELGIAEKDIQTNNFNIYAQYNNDGTTVTGYTVSNIVSVKIRDLDQTGTLLDQVVQEGANRVYGISFAVDNTDDLLATARTDAVADARTKAAQLAQESGAQLGEVLAITENIGSAPPMPMAMARDVAAEGATGSSVPVQTGEQSYSANVQVTFALR